MTCVSLDTNSIECFHHKQLISGLVNRYIEVTPGPPSLHTSPQQTPKASAPQSSPSTCRTAGQHSSADQLPYESCTIKTSTYTTISTFLKSNTTETKRPAYQLVETCSLYAIYLKQLSKMLLVSASAGIKCRVLLNRGKTYHDPSPAPP